ncbi:hypothetical protein ACFL2U_03610 [Patescibacteria group bacterium]
MNNAEKAPRILNWVEHGTRAHIVSVAKYELYHARKHVGTKRAVEHIKELRERISYGNSVSSMQNRYNMKKKDLITLKEVGTTEEELNKLTQINPISEFAKTAGLSQEDSLFLTQLIPDLLTMTLPISTPINQITLLPKPQKIAA